MKISVPLNIKTLNEESLPEYYEQIKAVGAERVFICSLSQIACEGDPVRRDPEPLRRAISYFKERGLEVGVWLSALGHGRALYSDAEGSELGAYQPIVGLDGRSTPYGLCPLGEKFVSDYLDGVRLVASLSPDFIMLDDDLRFNRGKLYYMGCFCEKHLAIYRKKLGRRVTKRELRERIFAGGENEYRNAFLDMLSESLIDFCHKLRAAVDEIDPNIRMGACSVRESVDYDGGAELIAMALAGGTKPYLRTSGAPYGGDIIEPAEFTRLQLAAYSKMGIETLTEGDTYPRPRYNLPYNLLRLYDLILIADGKADGRLDYIFDYNHRPEYDPSYVQRYARDLPLFEGISDMFSGKRADGIFVYNKLKKLKSWCLPENADPELIQRLAQTAENPAAKILSRNTIPTSFEVTDYPIALFGENARGIDSKLLSGGAIIDAVAARILSDAGIDTGLLSSERIKPYGEYFKDARDTVVNVDGGWAYGMSVKSGAVALSYYLTYDRDAECGAREKNEMGASDKDIASCLCNDRSVASYCYKNAEGESFLVLGADLYLSQKMPNFTESFYREGQIKYWIESMGKKLPATVNGNPNLYIYTARGEDSLSVLLVNAFADEVPSPQIKLDREYKSARFLGCSGELSGDRLTLSDICPYGYAAIELIFLDNQAPM